MPILKNLKQHKILLDTHIWIWVMLGNSVLTSRFRLFLRKALKSNSVLLSPMSIWEIGMLKEKKRIDIEMDIMDWVNQALDTPGIELCDMNPRMIIHSTRLTGDVHGDPVDRILIATAYEKSAVLVTCDKKLLEYGKKKMITAYNPTKN